MALFRTAAVVAKNGRVSGTSAGGVSDRNFYTDFLADKKFTQMSAAVFMAENGGVPTAFCFYTANLCMGFQCDWQADFDRLAADCLAGTGGTYYRRQRWIMGLAAPGIAAFISGFHRFISSSKSISRGTKIF